MQLRPLHPDFGVEVVGFDIEQGGSPDEVAQLVAAYEKHAMLLFRGAGKLPHERHVEIAKWFGPPAPVDNTGDGGFVSVLENSDMAGSMRLPFHSDMTYTDDPTRTICLQAVALPDGPTSTTFVSGMAAWENMPDALRSKVDGKTLRHFYAPRIPDFDWPDFHAEHPVRFDHPRMGRPVLFVTENHAQRVLELDEAESDAAIAGMFETLYAPERQYEHVWQENDVLVWDNLALQHARTERSDPATGPRALQRVALCDSTLDQLIERAREKVA